MCPVTTPPCSLETYSTEDILPWMLSPLSCPSRPPPQRIQGVTACSVNLTMTERQWEDGANCFILNRTHTHMHMCTCTHARTHTSLSPHRGLSMENSIYKSLQYTIYTL